MNQPVMLATIETPRQDHGMTQEDIDKEIDKWISQFGGEDIVMRNHYESLDALEKDWYLYQSMCYEHKVLSNNVAYRLYGMKNEDIYYKMKVWFLKHDEIPDSRFDVQIHAPRSFQEIYDIDVIGDMSPDPKDTQARLITQDTGYYIITNQNSSPEELNKQLYKFRSMSKDKQVKADTFSLQIYGKKNEDRYAEMMPKLLAQQDIPDIDYNHPHYLDNDDIEELHPDVYYDPMEREVEVFTESNFGNSVLGQYEAVREQIALDESLSITDYAILLESVKDVQPTTILENWYRGFLIDTIEDKVHNLISSVLGNLRGMTAPLEPEQMMSLGVFSDNNYFGPGKQNTLSDWFTNYQAQSIGLKPKMNLFGTDWTNKIRFLANGLEDTKQEHQQQMLELGYNPALPVSTTVIQIFVKKNNKAFEESCGYDFIDLHEMTDWMSNDIPEEVSVGKGLYVVFISNPDLTPLSPDCPRVFVGLDSTLSKLYSITNGWLGSCISLQDIHRIYKCSQDVEIKVYFLAFSDDLAERVNRMITYYRTHGFDYRFKYSFINGICSKLKCAHPDIANEKRFCIYLMNMILSIAHMDYTNPGNYMILPTIANLRQDTEERDHIYHIYSGALMQYNPNQVANLLNWHLDYEPITESMKCLIPYTRIVPIQEATPFSAPNNFQQDANIFIQKHRNNSLNLKEEYEQCKEMLKQYSKVKAIDPLRYYVTKLWHINLIIEDRIQLPSAKEKENIKQIYKFKETVLKTFTKYHDELKKLDPKFDLNEYYKASPFSQSALRYQQKTGFSSLFNKQDEDFISNLLSRANPILNVFTKVGSKVTSHFPWKN